MPPQFPSTIPNYVSETGLLLSSPPPPQPVINQVPVVTLRHEDETFVPQIIQPLPPVIPQPRIVRVVKPVQEPDIPRIQGLRQVVVEKEVL